MSATLRESGRAGLRVDPDAVVIRPGSEHQASAFTAVDDAVAAAERWIRRNRPT